MSAPDVMSYSVAGLAWKILANNLPSGVVLRWENVVATLKIYFEHPETAHLQLAAPDLLAACVRARKALHNEWHNKPRIGHEEDCAVLDAAIKKAQGR